MKTKFYSILLASILSFLLYSCEEKKENTNDDNPLVLTGEVINHTDCKIFKSAHEGSETPDTLSCISYDFDALNNMPDLTVVPIVYIAKYH